MDTFKAVAELIIANKGVVLDDDHGGTIIKLIGFAALVGDVKVTPVALLDEEFYSLRPLYIKEGQVRLGSESVAGILVPMHHNGDIIKTIEAHNKHQAGNRYSCGTIEHVSTFKPWVHATLEVKMASPCNDPKSETFLGR